MSNPPVLQAILTAVADDQVEAVGVLGDWLEERGDDRHRPIRASQLRLGAIGPDGLCNCGQADTCPLVRMGAALRCPARTLVDYVLSLFYGFEEWPPRFPRDYLEDWTYLGRFEGSDLYHYGHNHGIVMRRFGSDKGDFQTHLSFGHKEKWAEQAYSRARKRGLYP